LAGALGGYTHMTMHVPPEISIITGFSVFFLILAIFSCCFGKKTTEEEGEENTEKKTASKKKPASKKAAGKKPAAKKSTGAKEPKKTDAKKDTKQKKGKEEAKTDKTNKKAATKAEKKKKVDDEEKVFKTRTLKGKQVKVVDSDSSDDDDDPDKYYRQKTTQTEKKQQQDKLSAGQLKRKKAKEKKEQEAVTSGKPIVDADGFTSVVVKRRVKKKPAPAGIIGGADMLFPMRAEMAGTTYEMPVNPSSYGIIIGPKGATLMTIQEKTLAKIDIPKKDSDKKTVTISGSPEAIQACKKAINDLLTKGFSAVTDPGVSSSSISVPSAVLGSVIGPRGMHIQVIQQKTGTKIATPDRDSGSDKVTISGEKEGVQQAKEAIKMLVKYRYSTLTHAGYVKEEIPFPRDSLKTLIGPGGQTIKSIQGDTKTMVTIPTQFAANQNLVIVGPAAGVSHAIKQIRKVLDRENEEDAGHDDHYADPEDEWQEADLDDDAQEYLWKS